MVSDDDNIPGRDKPGGVRGQRHRLLGPRRESPNAPPRSPLPAWRARSDSSDMHPRRTKAAKKRVLFVCIGNSFPRQMAEAFARAYGSDVMEGQSAGVRPATLIPPQPNIVAGE